MGAQSSSGHQELSIDSGILLDSPVLVRIAAFIGLRWLGTLRRVCRSWNRVLCSHQAGIVVLETSFPSLLPILKLETKSLRIPWALVRYLHVHPCVVPFRLRVEQEYRVVDVEIASLASDEPIVVKSGVTAVFELYFVSVMDHPLVSMRAQFFGVSRLAWHYFANTRHDIRPLTAPEWRHLTALSGCSIRYQCDSIPSASELPLLSGALVARFKWINQDVFATFTALPGVMGTAGWDSLYLKYSGQFWEDGIEIKLALC